MLRRSNLPRSFSKCSHTVWQEAPAPPTVDLRHRDLPALGVDEGLALAVRPLDLSRPLHQSTVPFCSAGRPTRFQPRLTLILKRTSASPGQGLCPRGGIPDFRSLRALPSRVNPLRSSPFCRRGSPFLRIAVEAASGLPSR